MSIQQSDGSVNLQAALNRLVKAGTVDPNILLKYSQNPPPDLGDMGALLVSLASSIVARNNDGKNDLLAFEYLEFYPENQLRILNRWGAVVFEQTGYANTWDGDELTDGVYFYVLTLTEKNQTYSGFFHLIR